MSRFTRPGLTPLNRAFANLAVWSFQNKWLVFIVCAVILGVSVMLAQQVRTDNSFEAFFDETDPTYAAYKIYQDNFGSDEIIYILYDASAYPHGIFNKSLIDKVYKLGQEIEQRVPFVRRVRSISNAELMIGKEDELIIRRIEDELPLTQEQLLGFADGFKNKLLYVGNLFDQTQKFGGIVVEMSVSSTDPVDKIRFDPKAGDGLENMYPQVSNAALNHVLQDEQFAGIPFYVSGDVPLNATYNEIVADETVYLGGATLLIIVLILAISFRGRIIGVIGPLAVVGFATLMTVAFMAIMGWDMDMMFVMAPTLLLAIGVAHSVHIISVFLINVRHSGDRKQALYNTLYLVGAPCLITSLTTAVGFFSMSLAPILSISHMAIYMSMGVLFAFFLSITLLTFFLNFARIPKQIETEKVRFTWLDAFLRWTSRVTLQYPKRLMFAFLLLVVGAGSGIALIEVDSNYLMDFSDRVQVKLDTQYIDNHMNGMGAFAYLLDTKQEGNVKEPEFLRELERLQNEVEKHYPLVRTTSSLVDLIKEINQTFHSDNPEYYRLPDNRELIAQYLLVYELSGGEELFSYVTQDYSQALLQMRVQVTNSSDIAAFDQSIRSYLDKHPIRVSEQSSTGIGALWLKLMDYISDSQSQGIVIALLIITLLISIVFGSLKLGLVSMIPNVAPIIIVCGVMGWLGIYLDYSKLLLAPVAIGIAVDDTIHMMTRFKLEFERRGNYRAAIEATIQEVGKALIITSVTLVCGFSATLFSIMTAQVVFGLLLSSTIILALIADFFIMPILVLWLKPFGEEREPAAADTLIGDDRVGLAQGVSPAPQR